MSKIIKSSLIIDEITQSAPTNTLFNKDNDIEKTQLECRNMIAQAHEEAEGIISTARVEADKFIENAYKKAEEIIEEAKESGYNEGYNIGYAEGKKISDELINEANQIKKGYLEEKHKILSNLEKDIIELVIKICEKIINKKFEDEKEAIIHIIIKGLQDLNPRDNVIIRVSKEDFNIVELSKERILSMASLIEDITIKVDNTIDKGGCIIETTQGNVDVSVNSQIKEMKMIIYNLLNSE